MSRVRFLRLVCVLGASSLLSGLTFACSADDDATQDSTVLPPESGLADSSSAEPDSTIPTPDAGADAMPDSPAPILNGQPLWAHRFGETGGVDDSDATGGLTGNHQVVMDAAGNIYIAGTFDHAVSFGGPPLQASEGGNRDIYLVKFSNSGVLQWTKQFAGTDAAAIGAIAIDPNNSDILLAGAFLGTIDFGGGALTSLASADAFVVRLTVSGAHIWSKRFGGPGAQGLSRMATVGTDLVVLGTQSANASVDFGGPAITARLFVVRLNRATGEYVWSRQPVAGTMTTPDMAIDAQGAIVLAGGLIGSLDWGTGTIVEAGSSDIVVAKLDSAGTPLWAKRYGDASRQAALSVAVGPGNAIVIAGFAGGSMDFGMGPTTPQFPSSPGAATAFVAKLDPTGNGVWAKAFSTNGPQVQANTQSVAVDAMGNILIAGEAQCALDFGGGLVAGKTGVGNGYLAKLDTTGKHLWSRGISGNAGSFGTNVAKRALLDTSGNAIVTAAFENQTVDLGTGPLAAISKVDMLLAKFGP